jgi:hypothetical protein
MSEQVAARRAVTETAARHEIRTLALALLASLVLWNLPSGGVVLYPFKLLATWLHELSHGLAMVVTGAGFDRVLIYRDTSGLAFAHDAARGGAFGASLIATAGYMGTPLWGAALLVTTPDGRRARVALLVYAALLVGSSLVIVDNRFGAQAIAAIGGGMAACAIALPARWRVAVAHFVAAQACIDALLDIRVLFRASQVIDGQELACTDTVRTGCSDAHNMALYTFGTTADWAVWTWAAIWLVWSLVVLFVALRWMARRQAGARATAPMPAAP